MSIVRQKPETLALIVALVSTITVLTVFLTDLLLARQRDLETGEKRVQHFGIMMAEHTARTFEAVDILLREMAADLSNNRRNWVKWESGEGWEYVAQRHSRAMPQLRDLIIFDKNGEQRHVSTYFPPPRVNIVDRPYFQALAAGREASTFGPYIGRNSGRYTYALARRIDDGQGAFAGVAFAAIEPAYLQEFCWSNRLNDDFEAVLINAKRQIVASCRPTDLSRQSPILGALADEALFAGKLRDHIPETGLGEHNGLVVSVSPVPGYVDLRVLTVLPQSSLLAAWKTQLLELSTLAVLVTAILLVGGLLVRRQVREMREMTAELAASHEHLEARVRDATQELAGQRDEAERASRAKSRFLAAASHDLRQPLHALSLFAADLQRQLRSGTANNLPRLAEQIATSTAMLGEMLDSLLDISRLDVAGIKPDIHPFPLGPLFERQADSFRRAAVDRNLTLRFRPTRLWLDSDPIMIERMIGNLVSNALRYTPSGGRVLVGARRRGDRISIEVRDSGMGIAPEHQAAIFAEFYQVGNTAREHGKGLGLGLSIVDRLARALNIEVTLNSKIGEGTTFALRVKGCPPQQATEQPPPSQESAGAIHFIGDSIDIRAGLVLAENWGYTVSREPGLGTQAPQIPRGALLVTEARLASPLRRLLPGDQTMIVLSDGTTDLADEGYHTLPTPVRPAKLRALLNQLQKTSAKSIP